MATKNKTTVEDYKNDTKKEAERLIQHVFPDKVVELNKLLETEMFQLSRVSSIATELNIPQPPSALESSGEPDNKKRKLASECSDVNGSKVYLLPYGTVARNANIQEMINVIKPILISLIEHSNKVKMWITFVTPKIEDGNNFGVSVQEDTLGEARQVETDAASFLDQMSRYYSVRAKLCSKVAKYPHLDDYRQAVKEIDEKQFISLRLMVVELRNQYASLHDMITKNLEKIKKPRSANADNLY